MKISKNFFGLGKSLQTWSKLFIGIRPKKNFNDYESPSSPDYSQLSSWACRPDLESKVFFKPNDFKDNNPQKSAHVFFIYPTSFFGNFNWNAPLLHKQSKQLIDDVIIPSQASVFNDSCEIFAPRYRQATFYSFLSGGSNAKKALDLAYGDVVHAFEYYLRHLNDGHPFIIAGHSQGSLLGMKLLEDFIEGKPLYHKFIAAYLPGYKLPAHKFDFQFKEIIRGKTAEDIHCILAWDSYLNQIASLSFLDNALAWTSDANGKRQWKKRLGVKVWACNPIDWNCDNQLQEKAGASVTVKFRRNKSLKWTDVSGDEHTGIEVIGLSKPSPHRIKATLKQDGLLYIEKPKDVLFNIGLLPGGNYHVHDYNLFYMSIKENVKLRIEKYFEAYEV